MTRSGAGPLFDMFAGAMIISAHAAPVTFVVSPDTHFTQCGGVPDVDKNVRGIDGINTLAGTAYPAAATLGGKVGPIAGIVLPGDLIDDGCTNATRCAAQWSNYTARFGVHADEGLAKFPAFEGVGNHDGGNSTDKVLGVVRAGVIARNKRRDPVKAGITGYSLSGNGMHYSWNWGGLHLVMLGVYPGTIGDCAASVGVPGGGCTGEPYGWHCPEHSLDFLIDDLKTVDKATPVVLFMHYGLQGFGAPGTVPWSGYSPDFWWSSREALAFGKAIAGYNIAGIIHGHTHACVFYKWDLSNYTGHVYDVYNAPALQKGGVEPPMQPSQYLTIEVDTVAQNFRVFQRVGDGWGMFHEKNLTVAPVPAPVATPAALEWDIRIFAQDGAGISAATKE